MVARGAAKTVAKAAEKAIEKAKQSEVCLDSADRQVPESLIDAFSVCQALKVIARKIDPDSQRGSQSCRASRR